MPRLHKCFYIGIWIGLFLLMVSSGWGYEDGAVPEGGTIGGRVTLKGSPPPARIYHLIFSPNITFCGKISDGNGNRLLREFRVSGDGGFQDVVVAVVGVPKGKPFDYTPELTIEHCRIGPFVTPIRNGHRISLINKDPIAHDVQAYTLKDHDTFAMFNKPLTPETIAAKLVDLRAGHAFFRTQCGVHDYMQSWGMAVGNPYFAVSGPDGRFTIADLPPGEYDVVAWHPHMRVRTRRVRVEPNGSVDLQFEFDAAEVKIAVHDLQTEYRLQTALVPGKRVRPDIELQQE